MKWSERRIAAFLARVTFRHKCLVMVPNCSWPGNECDLLVLTTNLRVIDVEIKISRADLKADAKKDKWFHAWDWRIDGPLGRDGERRRRAWPRNVWKHYYAMPKDIWKPELLDVIPATSGVLLMFEHGHERRLMITVERMAKPNRDCGRVSAEDAVDIARLASFRMWDAYETIERLTAERMAA